MPNKIAPDITGCIGETPMIWLNRMFSDQACTVAAKLESANPGGSAKDRAALSMLTHAAKAHMLRPGTTVIESSSGNMAIGLAQVCALMGWQFICVVDPKTPSTTIKILRAYGTHTDVLEKPDALTGEYQPARIARVEELCRKIPNSFWPNQYSNLANAEAHQGTMMEIHQALPFDVDYLVCPVSTCGTIRGCSDYIVKHGLKTQVVAVDAIGSTIFSAQRKSRLLPGHGGTIRPNLLQGVKIDHVLFVSDRDCVVGCHELVRTEGILCGPSSGGSLVATARLRRTLTHKSRCVVILHDRGDRYVDTVFSQNWIADHLGPLPDFGTVTRES